MKFERIRSAAAPPALFGRAAQGVKAGPYVFVSAQTGSDGTPEPGRYGVKVRSAAALEAAGSILQAGGSSLASVIKVMAFHADLDTLPHDLDVRRQAFTGPFPPPSTAVESPVPEHAEVQLDLIGAAEGPQPEVISSDHVPRPLAPYSQAVRCGDLVFAAGILAADFRTGVAAEARGPAGLPHFHSPIKLQTAYVLRLVEQVLEAAGSSLGSVLKAQVALTDIRDFWGFEEVWRERFGGYAPPRTVFQGGLVNPGCLIEVDIIAAASCYSMPVVVTSDEVPRSTLHESNVVRGGDLVFVGGLLPTDYVDGLAPAVQIDPNFPRYAIPFLKQGEYVVGNLGLLLGAAGTDLSRVAKLWVFMTDLDRDLPGLVELFERFFGGQPPAVCVVGTPQLPIPGARIAVDAIAALP